jgi:hypothetical protein
MCANLTADRYSVGRAASVGRMEPRKLTSDDHGNKSDPDYQAQFIKQVAFPGLDLCAYLRKSKRLVTHSTAPQWPSA